MLETPETFNYTKVLLSILINPFLGQILKGKNYHDHSIQDQDIFFFYWPLGGGAPRAATHYLYTIGLDNYTRSYYGRTSLKISIKEHKSSVVEGRD